MPSQVFLKNRYVAYNINNFLQNNATFIMFSNKMKFEISYSKQVNILPAAINVNRYIIF